MAIRCLALSVLAAAAIAALPLVPSASAAATTPDRVIVEWAPGASPIERHEARADAEVEYAGDLGNRRFQLATTEPGQAPREAIGELEADPAVVLAERDSYLRLDSIPNDPLFGQLWGLQNTGLGIAGFSGAVAGADINVLSAWERTVGTSDTLVADIDTGYRFEHPDLTGVAWTNPGEIPENGLDDDGDGVIDDVHGADFVGSDAEAPAVDGDPTDDDLASPGGHGVHTAGTIGAKGANGIGITGVAQSVSIMPLRVCSHVASQSNESCPASAIVAAVNYAGAHGVRVANLSLGNEDDPLAVRDAIAANPQTLFVASAGNSHVDDGSSPHYPCVFNPLAEGKSAVDNVICVAATNQADQLAEFSNWGASTVDLGAPGTQILSTYPITHIFQDDFEVDDFATRWTAGPNGGFARTNEAPLTSNGITDTPGTPPDTGSIKESTSVPVMVSPGYEDCVVTFTRRVSGNRGARLDVLLDGEPVPPEADNTSSGWISRDLGNELSEGGEVSIRVKFNGINVVDPNAGVWFDDIDLHCIAEVGQPGGYAFLEGTSMAAPQVTGTAALLFSLKPSASVTEVRQGLLGSVDPVPSLAGKTTSGGRLDAGAATALFDSVPPPVPDLSATNPSSPSKNNQPRLKGSAQPGTTVELYANAACTGSPVASGTAAQFAGAGIAVTVGDGTETEFSARATDMTPLDSDCSAPISYTENTDVVAPSPPQLTGTDPASPSLSGVLWILGAAEAGSTERVYAGSSCAGSPIATASAATLGSPGIPVQVAEGATAVFSATATDPSANTSDCSEPISYTRLKVPTDSGGDELGGGPTNDGSGPEPSPACVVPRLAGKTLAQAKVALARAACGLGTVRRPHLRKGRRSPPLVVKFSVPAAGAKPVGGKVNVTLGPRQRNAHHGSWRVGTAAGSWGNKWGNMPHRFQPIAT
jgi:subtilisin family serine protease